MLCPVAGRYSSAFALRHAFEQLDLRREHP